MSVVGDTILAGADTAVWVSVNGGANWNSSVRPALTVQSVDAVRMRNGRLYAGSFNNGVFVSDNLGASWQSFNQGLVGGLFDTQLDVSDLELRGDSLLVSSQGAGVYVRNLALGGSRLLACAGGNGTVFDRDPGDADWTQSFLVGGDLFPGMNAQTALFTGSRWVVGTSDGVFLSPDANQPWTPTSVGLASLQWSTFAKHGSTLFGAFTNLNNAHFQQSPDDGTTWTPMETVNGAFSFRLAAHGDELYSAQNNGLWVRSTTITGVPGTLRRASFALAGANPVRELARFRFDLPEPARIAVQIFDARGRRAAPTTRDSWTAGPHELAVDTRSLGPGVYTALFTGDGIREALRLVRVP